MNKVLDFKNQIGYLCFLTKRELKTILKQSYFYISAIFFVCCTAFFHFIGQNFFSMDFRTASLGQFFLSMPYISILVIPTLVMNIWNIQNDIFSSLPISICKTIISKFFALIILFAGILLLTLPVVFFTNTFGDVSFPTVFSGYLVILLYGACVISLSIFIFSFFQNKAVAFLITAIILALVDTVHFLPLYVDLPYFATYLARFFSVSWHFDAASKGILDSRDCLFYIILAILFCILTYFHIKSQKKGKFFKEVIFYPIIAILLLLNINLYYFRIDLTEDKQFSLSEETKTTLKTLHSPLEITYYLSEELEKIYPQVRDIKDFLYQLSYENSLISVKIVNPQEKNLENQLNNLGIYSQQIQSMEDNKISISSVYSSILIENGSDYRTIPFVISSAELEYNLLTRIKNLVSNFSIEVLVLVGNGLSLENEYCYVAPWLESAGCKVVEVSANQLETLQIAPNQCLIVLGSSKLSLNDAVSIEKYLQNGGRALFAVSPNTVDISSSWVAENQGFDPIIDMLSNWGFSVGNQLIQDLSNYRIRMYATTDNYQVDYNNSIYVNYPFWVVTLPQFTNPKSIITEKFSSFESYWPSPISISETGEGEYTPLIYTSNSAWLQAPYSIVESQEFVTDPFSSANSKPSNLNYGQYLIAATFSGNLPAYYLTNGIENTKITVISDQYFPSVMIENTMSSNNLNFLVTNCIYLSENENLISIKNKGSSNQGLYKIIDPEEFNKQKNITISVCLFFVPTLILFTFVLQLVLRKKINKKNSKILKNEK